MLSKEARIKQKGQVTIPVEIRDKFELDQGSRVIFEDRGTYIAILPTDSLVDRTAGALSDYAKNGPLEWDRDEIWTEIATERWDRLQRQVNDESGETHDRG